jgi:hypothetical protein
MSSKTKKRRCANCQEVNPSHNYKDCPRPCKICKSSDHKTRSCDNYNLNKRQRQKTKTKTTLEPTSKSSSFSNDIIDDTTTQSTSNMTSSSLSNDIIDDTTLGNSPISNRTLTQSTSNMTSSSLSNDIIDDNMISSSINISSNNTLIQSTSNMTSSSLSNDIIDDNMTSSSINISLNNKNDTNMTSFLNTPSKNNDDNISSTLPFSTLSLNASSNENNSTNDSNSMNRDIENVISENGVFFTSAMTAAATFPSYFKSITVLNDQIRFCTNKGSEGTINLHTNEGEVRNVREAFQYINVNYINKQYNDSLNVDNSIKYTMTINSKQPAAKQGQLNKIRQVGGYLSQAKYYSNVLPVKIPLRKTDIPPADWRIEKYVYWERQSANNNTYSDDDYIYQSLQDQNQFISRVSGSIYDDPPDANKVLSAWKNNNQDEKTYFINPPLLPEENQNNDFLSSLSDYIEYLSEGLKFVQYNYEISRRSELRYCSYLDNAVEVYKEKVRTTTSSRATNIFKVFLSDESDNDKEKAYLCKKKMVGKRLNRLMEKCHLNWSIIDCVEELTANFLTNTVQEETFNILIQEVTKDYTPKYKKKQISDLCKLELLILLHVIIIF